MGDGESARIKQCMDELKTAAKDAGYEVFIYVEKDKKYRFVIDMDLPAMEKVFSIIAGFYNKIKQIDLLKN